MTSTPKAPAKTAEQIALEKRQRMALDEEIEEAEGRQKALAKGALGRVSLLSGAPKSIADMAGGRKPTSGGGSLLSGVATGSSGTGAQPSGRSLIPNRIRR